MIGGPDRRLVVGAAGASELHADTVDTVEYGACAALLAWPDGGRLLIGEDAITVRIEPTVYRGSALAVPAVDAAVGPARRVDMPARDADDIPRPDGAAAARQARSAGGAGRGSSIAMLSVLWLLLVPMVILTLLLTIGTITETGGIADLVVVLVFAYAIDVALAVGLVRATRRLRRRR